MGFSLPADLVRAYALEQVAVVRQFESYGNEGWLIADGRGQRFVLRRHRLNAGIDRIELQLSLQQHLANHGFPTSIVVETNTHQRFAIDAEGVPWVLFEYVEGTEYDFARPQQTREAGRFLANFHLITESFHLNGPHPEYKVPLAQCWSNASQDLIELAGMLQGDGVPDDLQYLSEWWHAVLGDWPLDRLAHLPSGWLHGDYHGRNMVFDPEDHAAGLFDFDDTDRGPYAFDVANGMVKFGRVARGGATIRPNFARTFIEGYEEIRPLTREERAALPMMTAMGYPPNPTHYRYWRNKRGEAIEHRFHREVATIRSLRAQLERIGSDLVL